MANLGFVVSEFNRDITREMEEVAREAADDLDSSVADTVYVPGTYDMPLAVKSLLEREEVDAVVTIGVVIEGDTMHDEVIVGAVAPKLVDLSLEYDKPVALGVSGPGMSADEAWARVDYAERAVETAVKLTRRI